MPQVPAVLQLEAVEPPSEKELPPATLEAKVETFFLMLEL